jgi:Leucine rich repeat/Leucine Rich repeat
MRRRLLVLGLAYLVVFAVRPAAGDEAADEQKAMDAIRKTGGAVQVDTDDQGKPAYRVDLSGAKVTDAELAPLESLPNLRVLNLVGAQVTDAGLAHVQRLTKLRKLYLAGTPITDAGLARLEDLPRLQVLDLAKTKITDAGLEHLADLPRLQILDLSHTAVTGAGLEHLKKLDDLKELHLLGLKPADDKGSEFEEKVLDFLKAQPKATVVR